MALSPSFSHLPVAMRMLFFCTVVIALFAIFIWPTRYKHYPPGEGPAAVQLPPDAPVRVDRITGDIEVEQTVDEWRRVGNVRRALAFEQPAMDPTVTQPVSPQQNRQLADQQQRSVERTQQAVQAATSQGKQ